LPSGQPDLKQMPQADSQQIATDSAACDPERRDYRAVELHRHSIRQTEVAPTHLSVASGYIQNLARSRR